MGVKRRDGRGARWYEVREGVWYKSCTTVLSMMPTSPWFIKWLQSHTVEEASILLNDAGLRGSKVHHTGDLILSGEEVFPSGLTEEQINREGIQSDELKAYFRRPFTEEEDGMLRNFVKFLYDYQVKPMRTEFTVWSDKIQVAGTMDFYGEIHIPETLSKKQIEIQRAQAFLKGTTTYKLKTTKVRAIVDWKTGKGIYESHYRQVGFYFTALKEMIKNGILTLQNPQRAFLLHLSAKKYDLIEVKDCKEQYKRFCATNLEWEIANPNAKPDEEYVFANSYKYNYEK